MTWLLYTTQRIWLEFRPFLNIYHMFRKSLYSILRSINRFPRKPIYTRYRYLSIKNTAYAAMVFMAPLMSLSAEGLPSY
ncbi:hypothetical protein D3C84_957680 [compost metagenome]